VDRPPGSDAAVGRRRRPPKPAASPIAAVPPSPFLPCRQRDNRIRSDLCGGYGAANGRSDLCAGSRNWLVVRLVAAPARESQSGSFAQPAPPKPVAPKPGPFDVKPSASVAPVPVTRSAGSGCSWWLLLFASVDADLEARRSRKSSRCSNRGIPPSAIDTHYLVILGSGLSQDNAESLRERAIASGLPPDTYIKKYPASH